MGCSWGHFHVVPDFWDCCFCLPFFWLIGGLSWLTLFPFVFGSLLVILGSVSFCSKIAGADDFAPILFAPNQRQLLIRSIAKSLRIEKGLQAPINLYNQIHIGPYSSVALWVNPLQTHKSQKHLPLLGLNMALAWTSEENAEINSGAVKTGSKVKLSSKSKFLHNDPPIQCSDSHCLNPLGKCWKSCRLCKKTISKVKLPSNSKIL